MTIEAVGLSKRYSTGTLAVQDVSFSVAPGELFGLLGNNGAGKSTTIGMLTTRLTPTSGLAKIDGLDVARSPVAAKARIGVVPQTNTLDRQLTTRHTLIFHLRYFGFGKRDSELRTAQLLERFRLESVADTKAIHLSGGMARRLMIARAVSHGPGALFLDEPSAGLDVRSRAEMIDTVRSLAEEGTATVLTTHDIAEAEQLCSRLGVMVGGRIVHLGSPYELRQAAAGHTQMTVRVADGAPALAAELASARGVLECKELPDGVSVSATEPEHAIRVVLAFASLRQMGIPEMTILPPTLESVILQLTSEGPSPCPT